MSKVKIQGNASGTGVVTLTAPNTNTDRTITLPDEDITLGGGVDGIVSTANATAITIDANENVGIGVTPESWDGNTPALQLGKGGSLATHANNPTKVMLSGNFYSNSSGTDSYIETNEASQFFQEEGAFQFRVAPSGTADNAISWTTAMTIANDGTISNTATSGRTTQTLKLGGGSLGGGIGQAYQGIYVASTANASDDYCYSADTGYGKAMRVLFRGTEVGSITCWTTSTSYNTSSDYRLKENVVPMTGSINRLKELKPSRFNFIADPDTTVDGFLAHEAAEVVPEAITGEKDAMRTEEYEVTPAVKDDDGNVVTEAVMGTREVEDYQGIDQSKLVPLLVASLQEAVEKIEALEARVTQLENN